jgi:hypothetical protein
VNPSESTSSELRTRFVDMVTIVLRFVASQDTLIDRAGLSQFGAKVPARGTSRMFASGCCRPIHRGIGPAFNTLSMERTMAAKKKKAAKKGGAKKKK